MTRPEQGFPFDVDWDFSRTGYIAITPEEDSHRTILFELIRQADRVAKKVTLPGETPLTDDQVSRLLPGIEFSEDGRITGLNGEPVSAMESGIRKPLIDSDALKLAVDFQGGNILLNSGVYEMYHGQETSLHVVRSTMLALEINRAG